MAFPYPGASGDSQGAASVLNHSSPAKPPGGNGSGRELFLGGPMGYVAQISASVSRAPIGAVAPSEAAMAQFIGVNGFIDDPPERLAHQNAA